MTGVSMDEYLSLQEAGRCFGVSRSAFYPAIASRRVKAIRKNGRWFVLKESLQEYTKSRYDRTFSVYNGAPLFDKDKGECSIKEAAKILRANPHALYYLCRTGQLKYEKRGSAYVLQVSDIEELKRILPSRQ